MRYDRFSTAPRYCSGPSLTRAVLEKNPTIPKELKYRAELIVPL